MAELGGGRGGPYTGTYFRSSRATDIERIVGQHRDRKANRMRLWDLKQ